MSEEGEPAIQIDGVSGKLVMVTLHARLAELTTSWVLEVDGFQWIRKGFLAWPDGQMSQPAVWTPQQMRLEARLRHPPQSVRVCT